LKLLRPRLGKAEQRLSGGHEHRKRILFAHDMYGVPYINLLNIYPVRGLQQPRGLFPAECISMIRLRAIDLSEICTQWRSSLGVPEPREARKRPSFSQRVSQTFYTFLHSVYTFLHCVLPY